MLPSNHPFFPLSIHSAVHSPVPLSFIHRLIHVCQSIHPPMQLSTHPSIHLSIHPAVHLSICSATYPSTHATLHAPIHPPIHPPSCPFIHLFIHLPIYLPVHISVHPFICVSITSRSSGLQVSQQPTHVAKGKDGRWQALLRAFSHTLVCTHGGNTKWKADEMRPRRKLPQASAPSTPLGAHPSLILLLAPHLTQSLHSPRKPFSFPNKLHLSSRQHCVFAKA